MQQTPALRETGNQRVTSEGEDEMAYLKAQAIPGADGDPASQACGNAVSLIDAGAWLDLVPLAALFGAIPADPYVPEGFRAKALARMRMHQSVPVVGPHEPLYQSLEVNPAHGGYERHYPPLADEMAARLGDALRLFQTAARLPEDAEVLVQAQRITTGNDGKIGHPAVEGFHQDDVSWVGILLIARSSLSGGMTLVSSTSDEHGLVFAGELQAGQLLVLQDRKVWHYTSPVYDTTQAPGHRDVILFGSPSCRRPASGRPS
jgi:hypothetical protein